MGGWGGHRDSSIDRINRICIFVLKQISVWVKTNACLGNNKTEADLESSVQNEFIRPNVNDLRFFIAMNYHTTVPIINLESVDNTK